MGVPWPLVVGKGVSELSLDLELAAHAVIAVLATWLGLLVLTRARESRGAPVFGFISLLLVVWSVAIIVQRIGTDAGIHPTVNVIEDVAAFLLPPATVHIAISVAIEGRRSLLAAGLLVSGYALGIAAGVQAALDPAHPIVVDGPPYWEPFGIPGEAAGWAFIGVRALYFGAAVAYLAVGLSGAGDDRTRRRQLLVALATVALGVVGGMARILPEEYGGPKWIGVSLVAAAMVMAAYAVLAQHLFIAADVAGRAFWWSLLAGIGVVAYVALLLGLETVAADVLAIDFPLVTALAVVVTIALFDPVSERFRALRAGSGREAAERRLLRALGRDEIVSQRPDSAVEPALSRLTRTFELTGAEVTDAEGRRRTAVGRLQAADPLAIHLPLADGPDRGLVTFGRKENGLPFTPQELEALRLAASYLGSTIGLARRHREQASALEDLHAEGAVVDSRGSALSEALDEATTPTEGLRVYALGPLRAERDGELIRRWGGEKAGSRQAEGVFAFLFDRGEQGASKDEILELIWPDVDLDRADVAFHRTMLGLRSMLSPGRRRGGTEAPIVFHNDRYRLSPGTIAWSDGTEFERLLASTAGAAPDDALRALEEARALYRGDYLDDCPYYGDSANVEDRRARLRREYIDILVELGERYADRGDRPAAANCLRQAQSLIGEDDESPRLADALASLARPRVPEPTA